jgi:hypothetical protein
VFDLEILLNLPRISRLELKIMKLEAGKACSKIGTPLKFAFNSSLLPCNKSVRTEVPPNITMKPTHISIISIDIARARLRIWSFERIGLINSDLLLGLEKINPKFKAIEAISPAITALLNPVTESNP